MSLLSKGKLYLRTVSHLKPSQVVYRLWRRLGGTTPLRRGHRVKGDPSCADIGRIPLLQELDFDTVFLKRFSPDDIVRGRIELLNCGGQHRLGEAVALRGNERSLEIQLALLRVRPSAGKGCVWRRE